MTLLAVFARSQVCDLRHAHISIATCAELDCIELVSLVTRGASDKRNDMVIFDGTAPLRLDDTSQVAASWAITVRSDFSGPGTVSQPRVSIPC